MKFTKKKATEFYKSLIGSARGMYDADYSWDLDTGGSIRYSAWYLDNRICLHVYLDGLCVNGIFFNKDTYEYDDEYNDKRRKNEFRDEVLEQAEYWQGQIKKYLEE
jgi:hypothetical protein